MLHVFIETIGWVEAKLIQRYLDGDVRVQYQGRHYIVRPANIREAS